MNDYQRIANQLKNSLKLTLSPVGIAFSEEASSEIQPFNGTVSAGCVFWQEAANEMFSTTTKDHELCSIGVHTHNLANPAENYTSELKESLSAMAGLDYVREEEVAQIPVLTQNPQHVIYGPLDKFTTKPVVVLLFANAQQGLIISEAISREDKNIPFAMGRPACAVIPQVVNQGVAAMSLGCCGARAYLDKLSDDLSLWAFPGKKIDAYCKQITTLAYANETLSLFHGYRKKDIDSGLKPSIQKSLERLSS